MRTRELHVLHRQGECIRERERKMEEGEKERGGTPQAVWGREVLKRLRDEEKERCCRALVSI